jgi:hypothetical protein
MRTIVPLIFSLFLILAGPELLRAKSAPTPAQSVKPASIQSVKDLETATADLQENTKDLRRNITNWRKIQWDSQLTPAEKKNFRDKAKIYLEECDAYNAVLDKVDAKKLPNSEAGRRFLMERQTFQRELQYLRETLQKP